MYPSALMPPPGDMVGGFVRIRRIATLALKSGLNVLLDLFMGQKNLKLLNSCPIFSDHLSLIVFPT